MPIAIEQKTSVHYTFELNNVSYTMVDRTINGNSYRNWAVFTGRLAGNHWRRICTGKTKEHALANFARKFANQVTYAYPELIAKV